MDEALVASHVGDGWKLAEKPCLQKQFIFDHVSYTKIRFTAKQLGIYLQ